MNKIDILKKIQQAKDDHIEWIKQGHKLLQGSPQSLLRRPLDCDECDFDKWYHDEGFKLVNIPELKALDNLHHDIHKTYTALYYITFDRRKTSRATLISGDIEVPVKEKAFRQTKLKQLEKKIVHMVRSLNSIEGKIKKMNDKDFESGWFI